MLLASFKPSLIWLHLVFLCLCVRAFYLTIDLVLFLFCFQVYPL